MNLIILHRHLKGILNDIASPFEIFNFEFVIIS